MENEPLILPHLTVLLVSKSPRRRELLEKLCLQFKVVDGEVNEDYPDNMPSEDIPEFLAQKKAQVAVEHLTDNSIILAADTIVLFDNEILGKPKNGLQAKEFLQKLSGKTHQVKTGVCLLSLRNKKVFSVITDVTFNSLSRVEIAFYVKHFQVFDKAGAYAIQDWIGLAAVSQIRGDYYNVVGLPVSRVYEALKGF